MSGINPLSVSDDDFLNMAPPEGGPIVVENPAPTTENTDPVDTDAVEEKQPENEEPNPEDKPDEEKPEEIEPEKEDTPSGSDPKDPPAPIEKQEEKKEAAPDKAKEVEKPDDGAKTPSTEESKPVDHVKFYEQVMTPFKANGKMITLKSPEEAIQLMQMGANYTRKMQDIQPHRKMLTMLQNNDLLDEGKLSFAIDLVNKNPEAIKKLIKDSNIDPLTIDMDEELKYQEGNHRVTDEEVNFRTVVEDLSSTPEGKETLTAVTSWDQASKNKVFAEPDTLNLIHQQREVGIYDLITTEMEKQKTLGRIPSTMSFIEAYRKVGDQLYESGAMEALLSEADKKAQEPAPVVPEVKAEPVAVRAATPKPKADNGEKAKAASTTRSTPSNAKTIVNPLAMSDDDFLKQMENRL